MRHILISALIIAAAALTGCDEPIAPGHRDAAITFTVDTNTAPESVRLSYYSPDPSCVGKMYEIMAGPEGGRLVITCNNRDSIFIQGREGSGFILDGDLQCIEPGRRYVSQAGQWTVSAPDRRTLCFDFAEASPEPDSDTWGSSNTLIIAAETSAGRVSTAFYVVRLLKH